MLGHTNGSCPEEGAHSLSWTTYRTTHWTKNPCAMTNHNPLTAGTNPSYHTMTRYIIKLLTMTKGVNTQDNRKLRVSTRLHAPIIKLTPVAYIPCVLVLTTRTTMQLVTERVERLAEEEYAMHACKKPEWMIQLCPGYHHNGDVG